jgi:hypothetical protein
MISDTLRESVYEELEREHPASGPTSVAFSPGGAAPLLRAMVPPRSPTDLAALWRQELHALNELLEDELLFQLHALFEIPAENSAVQGVVHAALEQLYALEQASHSSGSCDAPGYALFLLRRNWHQASDSNGAVPLLPSSLLTGLYHVQQASFFHKVPQEIAGWTRRFLMMERYHRLDAVEHERRLDRYRSLRTRPYQGSISSFDDLLIWLEFRLLGEQEGPEGDVSLLSRRISEELRGMLAAELFPGMPLQPAIYVLLRSHQFCLAEIIEPREHKRFQQILATRQLDSLLDLMRVVLHSTMREQRLPEVGALLDRLQSEGFNIEHQRFRDPYEAQLAPLEDTERFDTVRLPLFLSLTGLSGGYSADLEISRQMLLDWHQRIVRTARSDLETFVLAQGHALPQAHLIRQLIRFATSWLLAQHPWPLTSAPDLEEHIRKLLPENVVRQLVKPRKGYELKSKQDLSRLIRAENQRQREALQRIEQDQRIQGLDDYTYFTRYLAFQQLQGRSGLDFSQVNPEQCLALGDLAWESLAEPAAVNEFARKWSIDVRQASPHTLEALHEYFLEVSPAERILPELAKDFVASENERKRIYHDLLDQLVPVFHRILVAFGRHQAQLPRLTLSECWPDEIARMIRLLAPPLELLEITAHERVRDYLGHGGAALYRRQLPPCLFSAAEWRAYLAWETHRRVGNDVSQFLEEGNPDRLLDELQQAAEQVDLPPRELFVETVQSTLLALLNPVESGAGVTDEFLRDLVVLLPQLDCGACGQASCREFARALLLGRAVPQGCVQLPVNAVQPLTAKLRVLEDAGDRPASPPNPLDLFRDRRSWSQSPQRLTMQEVLSAPGQKARRLFLERMRQVWERLTPKPQIFKCPDQETFYQSLCGFIGYAAVERLLKDEKQLLVEHGDLRQEAEWQSFKQRQDWLALARRQRQSRPLLRGEDPAWVAAEGYHDRFFLHQLGARDRHLVLRHRLERHQDGFSHWWNEDLLSMNLPDFSIRDWEDLSKIIQNAYWHQEHSPGAGELLAMLRELKVNGRAVLTAPESEQMLQMHLVRFIDKEQSRMAQNRTELEGFRQGRPINNLADLRQALQGLSDEDEPAARPAGAPGQGWEAERAVCSPYQEPQAGEDRQALALDRLWERFQNSRLVFSAGFRCLWQELSAAEQEALQTENFPGIPTNLGNQDFSKAVTVISAWDETLSKRTGFLRALLRACIKERFQEQAEGGWLQARLCDPSPGRPPMESLRLFIRQRLRQGVDRRSLENELERVLRAQPELHQSFCEDVLHYMVRKRQFELLVPADESFIHAADLSEASSSAAYGFPEFKSALDRLLDRHQSLDRERLLHYLFLLAKMEGNLDALTALLREIRETSDIIEAAWLRFTEERVQEGPTPKSLPGTALGIPLLVSHLKDKEAVNRGLREGIGRREKRQVAAAFTELSNFIRYHVLLVAQTGSQDGDQMVLKEMQNAAYDLTGIDQEALLTAIQREWNRREQLRDQKILIYTTVTARRLAAQHTELQEAERTFYKVRLDLLKEPESRADQQTEDPSRPGQSRQLTADLHHDVASRRGVALGQIKEEMYRQLSDLLENERIATFQKRIRRIVQQLDRKRQEIHAACFHGEINRRTLFYLLRQHQKSDGEPTWEDCRRFLADHWLHPLKELRTSQRPDREDRIRDLDERLHALLGVSLLQLEQETMTRARQDEAAWRAEQLARLTTVSPLIGAGKSANHVS